MNNHKDDSTKIDETDMTTNKKDSEILERYGYMAKRT